MLYILYFCVGIFLEFLSTLYIRFVAERHSLRAAAISFVNTMIVMGMIYTIITSLQTQHNVFVLVVYAAGVGVGTYAGTRFKISKREW